MFTTLQPYLREGIPNIDVDSIDPVLVDEIFLNHSGIFEIKGSYKDVNIKGLTNFTILDVRSDMKVHLWR
jgi:hypothetical protein